MLDKRLTIGNFVALTFLILVYTTGVQIGYSYFTAKWLMLYGLTGLGILSFLFHREIPWPKLRLPELGFVFLVFLVAVGNTIWLSPSGFENSLLDRWSFFLLVWIAYVAFAKKTLSWTEFFWPVVISATGVVVIGLWQFSQESLNGEFPYTKVGSLFGYSNNTAQFIGICLVYLITRKEENFWRRSAAQTASILSFSYLILARSRSVYIGLFLAATFLIFRFFRTKKQRLTLLASILASILVIIPVQYFRSGNFTLLQHKEVMTSFRVLMAEATLHMIAEHPLGSGVDLYEFKALPYIRTYTPNIIDENFLAKSPHNEFLRYPAEDGIPASLLFFAAILWLMLRWRKARDRRAEEDNFVIALLLFYFSEAAAQFPFQNPLPFYVFAILIAWILHRSFAQKTLTPDIFRPIVVVLLAVQLYFFYFVAYSRLFEKSPDLDRIKLACSYMPSNWHACLLESKIEVQENKFADARRTLQNLIELQPENLVAMRDLSLVAVRSSTSRQSHIEACFYLWRYVDGYNWQTPLKDNLKKACPDSWIDYFKRNRPMKFLAH